MRAKIKIFLKDILELSKYKIALANAICGLSGFSLAEGEIISLKSFFVFSGIFFLAGSSGALNQILEREQDKLMKRTQSRPIPSGRISVKFASVITSLFLIAGFTLLYFAGKKTLLTAVLALFIYDFLYTPLKKISGVSVFVGAFVGALPPVSGYLSTKDKIDEITIILSLFMYIYQIPHTLSLFYVFGWDEWERAGFKTLSRLGREKIRKIIITTLLLSYIIGCVFIAKLILPAVFPFLIFSIFGMIRAVKNPREIFYSLNIFMLGVILTPIVKSIFS